MAKKMTHLEAPSINTSIETVVTTVVKVLRANYTSQHIVVQDLPAATMWHPTNDMLIIWAGKDGMKLHGKCHTASGLVVRVSLIWK